MLMFVSGNCLGNCFTYTSFHAKTILTVKYYINKGFDTRSENFNEIVSVTSYLWKSIVTIVFVNDFVQGRRAERYRLVALSRCILIG